ncbi:hypothetical protein DMUE_0042 [Dictyocoela muelleri]|nr:hypothetical protein DMUE_0042 [Dictyocoela muelleri]
MSSENISKVYPYAALFIHGCGMMVTKEKVKAIFEKLGLEFVPKLADLFSKSSEEFDQLISNASNASVSVSAVPVEAKEDVAGDKKKVEKEEEEEEGDLDFADLFD